MRDAFTKQEVNGMPTDSWVGGFVAAFVLIALSAIIVIVIEFSRT